MTPKPTEVSLKTRWLLYAGAWVAVFLSFFIPELLEGRMPDPGEVLFRLMFSWVFPVGLAAWFNPRPLDDIGLMAVLWLAYLVHGFFTLRSRTKVGFYSLLLILAIVLVFNVIGCHLINLKAMFG